MSADLDSSWVDASRKQDQTPPDVAGLTPQNPIHVKVANTQTERVAPEFTGWRTWAVLAAGSAQPVQICQRRYHRYKAKLIWTIPSATTVYLDNKPDSLSSPVPAPTLGQLAGPLTTWVMPDYDGQQPLYAVFTGAGPVTVTVIDESYGPVQ